jgi:fibro-slime domain-containing protein
VQYWFRYDQGTNARLDFTGDDDVWVYVNGHLAVDLGGIHVPMNGSVTINAQSAARFQLTPGKVYPIVVFQAERKKFGSTFRLTLSGFNAAPSDCGPNCGDGKIAPGEQCDDGTAENTGEYDRCSANCTLGPRCGDGEVQAAQGEECDKGADGNDGAYKGCAPNCKAGPRCGDGVVQTQFEKCDDGKNTGEYGTCNTDCTLAPRCGDGAVQMDNGEECDDANTSAGDSCNNACKKIHVR